MLDWLAVAIMISCEMSMCDLHIAQGADLSTRLPARSSRAGTLRVQLLPGLAQGF